MIRGTKRSKDDAFSMVERRSSKLEKFSASTDKERVVARTNKETNNKASCSG